MLAAALPAVHPRGARSAHKGVYYVPRTGRWRATLREGPVLRHLGYFAEEEAAGAAVKAAADDTREQQPLPPALSRVPGVAWHKGRWLVRGVSGVFQTLAEAEEAAHRKPRVRAMRGSVARRGKLQGAAGDRARSFISEYREWAARTRKEIVSVAPWKDMQSDVLAAEVRSELRARWRASRGGEEPAVEEEAELAAVGPGSAAAHYHTWVRRERALLLGSAELAGLDRVTRSTRVRQKLKELWKQEKEMELNVEDTLNF